MLPKNKDTPPVGNQSFVQSTPFLPKQIFPNEDFKYYYLFNSIEAMIVLDDARRCIDINPAACALFGVIRSKVIGMKLDNIVKFLAGYDFNKNWKSMLAKAEYIGELSFRRADGELCEVEYKLKPQCMSDLHLLMLQDIGDWKIVQTRLHENEKRFRALVQNSSDMIMVLGIDGTFIYLSATVERILGYQADELVGRIAFDYIHPEDVDQIRTQFQKMLVSTSGTILVEYRGRHKNGDWIYLESVGKDMIQDPSIGGLVINSRDIRERRSAEQALLDSQVFIQQIANSIPNILYVYDIEQERFVYLNQPVNTILGYSIEEIKEFGTLFFQDFTHPEDIAKISEARHRLLNSKTDAIYETDYRIRNREGDWRWLNSRDKVSAWTTQGKPRQILGTVEDTTERKRLEQQLAYEALHDALTGLPNRSMFLNQLGQSIEQFKSEKDKFFAVLFLDLDRFKIINDSLGHSAGDQLLINVAQRLETCLSSDEMVARLGGDEFTILLHNISDISEVTRVAKEIQYKLSLPFNLDMRSVFITTSIGIALSTNGYLEPEQILRDADTAMYRAKTKGRSRYEVFDKQMHTWVLGLLQLEADLRRAIENQEFQIYYQPIVSIYTGQITSCEALLRWNHPARGLIYPSEFIPIAEETGLIVEIDRWVLSEACAQNKAWQDADLPAVTVAVNLSPLQLKQHDLTSMVSKVLQNTGLEPRYLELELTESVVIEDAELSMGILHQFKEMGIDLSIDDFGTGFSSLTYLKQLPIDTLKIDQSFVRDITSDPENAAITTAIIALAHNLNLRVVAEGVETTEQLEFLRAQECDHMQGFLFNRPMPAKDIPKVLKSGNSYIFE